METDNIQIDYYGTPRSNYIDYRTRPFHTLPLYALKQYIWDSHENIYFLFLVCLQVSTHPRIGWLPSDWSPSGPWTTCIPFIVCFILELLSLVFQWCRESLQTYKYNDWTYCRVYRNHQWVQTTMSDIQIGDILCIQPQEIVPVDTILWSVCDNRSSTCVSYANLNGESESILKQSIQSVIGTDNSNRSNIRLYHIEPNPSSYKEFQGKIDIHRNTHTQTHVLGPSHFICAGCLHTGTVPMFALVVENGKRIRSYTKYNQLSSSVNRHTTLNTYVSRVLSFVFVPFLAVACGWISYQHNGSLQSFVQTWILLNGIVPFSARIVLRIKRNLQRWYFSTDAIHWTHPTAMEEMPHARYLVCDKTGTLTTNQLCMMGAIVNGQLLDLKDITDQEWFTRFLFSIHGLHTDEGYSTQEDRIMGESVQLGTAQYSTANGGKLQLTEWRGVPQNKNLGSIVDSHTCMFDCVVKRSSVLYYDSTHGEYVIVSKGSLHSIRELCCPTSHDSLETDETYVNQHYPFARTLAIAYRVVSTEWIDEYKKIPQEQHRQWMEQEGQFTYQTIVCMLDPLQPDVLDTLYSIPIPCSMCTGDRRETALYIASELSLVEGRGYSLVEIDTTESTCQLLSQSYTFLFSGKQLHHAIDNSEYRTRFLRLLGSCRNFIAYQLTPHDKKTIVKLLRTKWNAPVITVGDGNNDIPMFQLSTVSIAIHNGMNHHVVQSADVSMSQFSDLQTIWNTSRYVSATNWASFRSLSLRVLLIHVCMFFWVIYNEYNLSASSVLFSFMDIQSFHVVWGLVPLLSTVWMAEPYYPPYDRSNRRFATEVIGSFLMGWAFVHSWFPRVPMVFASVIGWVIVDFWRKEHRPTWKQDCILYYVVVSASAYVGAGWLGM